MAEKRKNSIVSKNRKQISRRQFIAGASAAAFSFMVVKPKLARGGGANSKINLGIIGCGGRGTWIADLFVKHGGYNIVAAADYFQDKVDAFGDKYQVSQAHCYTGLSCYKKLLEQKLDAVAIESPPYFHPEQAAAAVDAGCHVYLAKPVAVDVAGCRSVADSGKKAAANKLCFLVDLQTRADPLFCEAVRRVHNGDIGEIAFGESTYHCGRLGIKAPPGTPEARLRNWVFDKALSGDIITEQNIHTLDVVSWIMNEPPIYAVGTGGRKVRTDVGDCWDYFTLLYQYSNNVGITFSSRQFNGHGSQSDGIRNRMFGSKGVLEAEYGGTVIIRGENFYRGGRTNAIFRDGVVNNIATFQKNITEEHFDNPTVAASVRSNLVTILGRTAAYQGRQVRWDEIINSSQKLDGKLQGLKA